MDGVKRSLGTKLKIQGESDAVAVAGLTSISGLELSADTIDTTTLDSDGGYREFIAGFKDAGEVGLEGYLIPATGKGQSELFALFESGEAAKFIIEFPLATGTTWDFNGIVTGFSTGASLEDPLSFGATIKVSGAPTLTTAAVTP